MNGIFVAGIWGIYPWGARMNVDQGDYRDLWLVTAVFCAVTVLFLRMATCAVVLRSESLLVINPIGSKEVRYDGIRKVVAGPGAALKIVTVRGESLVPVVFGGSLLDYEEARPGRIRLLWAWPRWDWPLSAPGFWRNCR
ncbi:hypothetical protein [Streptomyces sp. 351MFTsu5.1]|uniref:hypothetical protein n=1 Tax=Streptomyces sp. 351MFTsu5.1 TaxID=1172180 RepID=UPI0018F8A4D8|nr:hypothetical protein [Streptomyces sp. 351MFTsu5.1]